MIKWDDILDILDKYGCKYENAKNGEIEKRECSDSFYSYFEFWTDTANKDVYVEVYYNGTSKDFIKEVVEYAISYNVDDEVIYCLPIRGIQGIPSDIRTLLEDCEEAKETLMNIAEDLQKLL